MTDYDISWTEDERHGLTKLNRQGQIDSLKADGWRIVKFDKEYPNGYFGYPQSPPIKEEL